MDKIKLMIVDDHMIVRMGLMSLLAAKKDIEVVGDAADGPSALRKVTRLKPDVVLMDLMMPGMDGTETTRRILEVAPETRVLILTTFGTADGIAHAIAAGAAGAVLKSVELPRLVEAIRKVAAGERVVSEEIGRILESEPPLPPLSQRQQDVLESIVRGLSNADIANQLGISLQMVKDHAKAIFVKLGAANRTEAVAIALKKHLLKI